MQNVRQSLGRLSARSRREEPSGSAVWASSSASFGVSAVASFSARLPGWYQTVFLTRPYSGLERPHYFLWSRNPQIIMETVHHALCSRVRPSVCHLHWSECHFTDGRTSHHQHPFRGCNFPDKTGPVDQRVFPTALQQMLLSVCWPNRCWP